MLFTLVVWQRDRIRAHWWAKRLASTNDMTAQGYYLACLAGTGDAGLGALERLAHSPRPAVRALAAFALQRLSHGAGVSELSRLLYDEDETVRESAATGLAFANHPEAVRALIRTSTSDESGPSAAAVSALARSSSPQALEAICAAARKHRDPFVRAQAVESLMDVLASDSQMAATTGPAGACDAVAVLVEALADLGSLTGQLSLEKQQAGAAAFVGAAGRPAIPARRTVGQAAAKCLTELTGLAVDPNGPWTDERRRSLAETCRQRLDVRRLGRASRRGRRKADALE